MAFKLSPLPYPKDALEPYMSAKTLEFHHGKHHKSYVDTLNELVAENSLEDQSLEELIASTYHDDGKSAVFNNAAQVWNHDFFWKCMKPQGGGQPNGALRRAIAHDFGTFDSFTAAFAEAASSQFGSGWAWLVLDAGRLKVVKTPNAVDPIAGGQTALLTCDVWEHAYYLDYQNRRADFVEAFLDNLANWEFAAENLETALQNQGLGAAAK
jgi:Fe-Mn family superoxide dismutase